MNHRRVIFWSCIILLLLFALWMFRLRLISQICPVSYSSHRFPLIQILISKDISAKQKLRQNADKAWLRFQSYGLTQRKLIENQEAQEMLEYFCNLHPELSSLTSLYSQIERPVMQADLMRYVVLYLYGGLYVDCSVVLKPFYVSENVDAVLFTETTLNSKQQKTLYEIRKRAHQSQCLPKKELYEYKTRIYNGIMLACKPRLSVFYHMIRLVHHRLQCLGTKTQNNYDVLFLTGPDIPSTVWNSTAHERVQVLSYWDSKQIISIDTSMKTNWRNT